MSIIKRLLLGRPLASEEASHQLLPKRLALPVFASDPLSSNAYATEEILLVLVAAGASTFWLVTPLSIVIASVVIIVITSYRQTIHAYPKGGGSYMVARENLGTNYGLVAAASLLTDYTLTVAVSIAAGVAAITSAIPTLFEQRVILAMFFIALVAVANLRGVKESGTIFAIPTYLFVLSVWVLIGTGIVVCLDACPKAPSSTLDIAPHTSLTIFLVLRAFASGSTALTGIEAIADGVGAFKRPQAHNAAKTLAVMGFFTLSMFLGLSFLARATEVVPLEAEIALEHGLEPKTVIAQIAETVFGGGFFFFLIQTMTAGILILAANTAYADFPRLSSILARDRFMPRQFMNRGDRLVFSNGVIVLSVLAAALVVLFDANVNRLIQLYVVGVFTTFTLSQAGMVQRWRRLRPSGWQRKVLVNGIGATTTGVVLVVVATTKFTHGAWIVILAIPLIVLWLRSIHKHYASVATQLRRVEERPIRAIGTRALVYVPQVDEASMRALGYARALRPLEVTAVHVGVGEEAELVRKAWDERRLNVPLAVIEDGSPIDALRAKLRQMTSAHDEFVTLVLPEVVGGSKLRHMIARRRTQLLKAALLFERRVVVTDVTTPAEENLAPVRGAVAPARTIAVLLVSAVHNATLQALEYARALSPTDLRAVIFNVEPEETAKVLEDWGRTDTGVSLEAEDSPFREVADPLKRYCRRLRSQHPDSVVSVILPEFVVGRWWHQFLHNQTALGIKAALLFEPGVTVTSVPFHLES